MIPFGCNNPAVPAMPQRSGWTLFELVVVMALLAVVTTGAAFTLRTPLGTGRLQSQIDAVLTADRTARSHARRFRQEARLEFDWKDRPTLRVVRDRRQSTGRIVRRIDGLIEVRLAASPRATDRVTITIDPAGRSSSYAIRFAVPAGGETWVAVAGETGQPIFDLTERDVDELWKALESADVQP